MNRQIHDLSENAALDSSLQVLIDSYEILTFPDGYPVRDILSFADHSAWAAHAALYRAALNVDGSATRVDDGDIVPDVDVKWGRLSYLNATESDTGPAENFPPHGPQGSGDQLFAYFAQHFGLSERQVVTLMGVHTFGGGRRQASGYAGMWTQTKNQFNNDYQLQLVFPLPLFCVPGECTYFSDAGTNKDPLDASNLLDMQTCKADNDPEDADRCMGWEQVKMPGIDGAAPKFQWRHSCKHFQNNDPDDVEGCTHLMLNVDVGLYLDLDGHICTAQDEIDGTLATLNRTCQEGMIKSYGKADCESDKGNHRVLASCFNLHPTASDYILEDASDYAKWMADFGPLFEMLLEHNLSGNPTLSTLTTPAPTPVPTSAPSASPSAAPTACTNKGSWSYSDTATGQDKKCTWIGRRVNIMNQPEACNEVGHDGTTATESCLEHCAPCAA